MLNILNVWWLVCAGKILGDIQRIVNQIWVRRDLKHPLAPASLPSLILLLRSQPGCQNRYFILSNCLLSSKSTGFWKILSSDLEVFITASILDRWTVLKILGNAAWQRHPCLAAYSYYSFFLETNPLSCTLLKGFCIFILMTPLKLPSSFILDCCRATGLTTLCSGVNFFFFSLLACNLHFNFKAHCFKI